VVAEVVQVEEADWSWILTVSRNRKDLPEEAVKVPVPVEQDHLDSVVVSKVVAPVKDPALAAVEAWIDT